MALNLVWSIACYGGGSDTGVVVDDWNTDSDHYLRIFTPYLPADVGRTQRHDGVWDDTKYFASTTIESPFDIRDNYVRLEGLQGQLDANTTYESAVFRIRDIGIDAGEVWVSHSIVRQINKAEENNYHAGLAIYEDAASVDQVSLRAFNNIIYDFDGAGGNYHAGMFINTVVRSYAYNNTIVDCHAGIGGWGENTSVKNNLMQNVVDSYYDMDAYNDSTNNLTNGSDQVPGTNVIRGSVIFANYASEDFHLTGSDTLARDAGADLSSDAIIAVTDDIDGHSRSRLFDIGADEVRN